MSCIQLSTTQTAAVAHGLAFMLNGSGGMCRLAAAPELFDALKSCRYPHDIFFDDRRIYAVLYRLNEAAYNGRYKMEPDDTDEVPAMPEKFPHLLHALEWDNGRYTIDRDFYRFTKLLDSFIYQCEEDCTRNSELLTALQRTSTELYSFIVQQSPDYYGAQWII